MIVEREDGRRLLDLETGEGGTFVRVSDADPAKLRHLAALGVAIGDPVEVRGRAPFGGAQTVAFAAVERAVDAELAAVMVIAAASDADSDRAVGVVSARTAAGAGASSSSSASRSACAATSTGGSRSRSASRPKQTCRRS